jgi:hypothetical protein
MVELALDCMMAISKVCYSLKFYHAIEKAKADTTLQASKVQKEIQDLKALQDIVVEFVDQLATSKSMKAMEKDSVRARMERIIKTLREI